MQLGGVAALATVLGLVLSAIPNASRPKLASGEPPHVDAALGQPVLSLPTPERSTAAVTGASTTPAKHAATSPVVSRASTVRLPSSAYVVGAYVATPTAVQRKLTGHTSLPPSSTPTSVPPRLRLVNTFFGADAPGQCVVPRGMQSGAEVIQARCPTGSYWTRTGSGSSYQLHLNGSGQLCLGTAGNVTKSGAPVAVVDCSGASTSWKSDSTGRIVSIAAPSLCLTGYAIASADRTYPNYLFPCDPAAANQNVRIDRAP